MNILPPQTSNGSKPDLTQQQILLIIFDVGSKPTNLVTLLSLQIRKKFHNMRRRLANSLASLRRT